MTSVSPAPTDFDRQDIRVGIVDDHAMVSEALSLALKEQGFVAVGLQPSSYDDIAAFVEEHALNVVLLDLNLGALGFSLPLIPRITELGCRVIVVTGETSRPQWGACIEAGALSVVSKVLSFSELLDRVTRLLDDVVESAHLERYELLESLRAHREEERRRLAPFEYLTVREHEVLLALTLGMSAEEIASSMFVSMATVRTHIRAILQKLGVKSQLAAVALATRAGWKPESA
jgi:two-component system, NarL family, nitrate/nitrite response regulator NarL